MLGLFRRYCIYVHSGSPSKVVTGDRFYGILSRGLTALGDLKETGEPSNATSCRRRQPRDECQRGIRKGPRLTRWTQAASSHATTLSYSCLQVDIASKLCRRSVQNLCSSATRDQRGRLSLASVSDKSQDTLSERVGMSSAACLYKSC